MEKKSFKTKLKSFSEDVFRNYLIVRARWELYNLERQHGNEIRNMGNRIYRQFKRDHIPIPEVEPILKSLTELDLKIEQLEERLRDLMMNAELPKQLTAETPPTATGPCPPPESIAEPVSAPEPDSTVPLQTTEVSVPIEVPVTIPEPASESPQKPLATLDANSALKSGTNEIQELRSFEESLAKDAEPPKKAKKRN